MQHKIVVQRHRPWLRAGVVAAVVGAVAVGTWALYAYTRATTVSGFERARLEVETLREERRDLSRSLRAARAEAEQLRDELVYVKRSQEIDSQTCGHVRADLDALQAEVLDLREQVAFYRGIVSPEATRAGVRVYSVKVEPTDAPSQFRFELVLIQSVRNERSVSGRIQVSVEGLREGRTETLNLSELSTTVPENLLFSFKYFQEFGGVLTLPSGFKPRRLRVQLQPEGGAGSVEEPFDWARALAAG